MEGAKHIHVNIPKCKTSSETEPIKEKVVREVTGV